MMDNVLWAGVDMHNLLLSHICRIICVSREQNTDFEEQTGLRNTCVYANSSFIAQHDRGQPVSFPWSLPMDNLAMICHSPCSRSWPCQPSCLLRNGRRGRSRPTISGDSTGRKLRFGALPGQYAFSHPSHMCGKTPSQHFLRRESKKEDQSFADHKCTTTLFL